MGIYLPIAEMSVNMLVLLAMGAAVGFLSGMFGVGGGFLITPLLIFYNIPPAIAVATGANQVVAASFSGALAHFRRGTLDLKLGTVLLVGGIAGSSAGIYVFALLRSLGQLDLIISLLYVGLLGAIGGLMLVESVQAIRRAARRTDRAGRENRASTTGCTACRSRCASAPPSSSSASFPCSAWVRRSASSVSVMGVGGGFIMVPALIYLLKVPTNVVIGTSLFQIIFVSAFTTDGPRDRQPDRRCRAGLRADDRRRGRRAIRCARGAEAARRTIARAAGASGAGGGGCASATACSRIRPTCSRWPRWAGRDEMRGRAPTFALLVALGLNCGGALAEDENPENIQIGLSTDRISITSDFSGADLTIFGSLDNARPTRAGPGPLRRDRGAAGPGPRRWWCARSNALPACG